jgi:hypothetical protein
MPEHSEDRVPPKTEVEPRQDAKALLEKYARELDYDDQVSGRALEIFSKNLRLIASRVDDLEQAGYSLRIDHSPIRHGGTTVYLGHGDREAKLWFQFYDTYGNSFPDWEAWAAEDRRVIQSKIDTFVEVAKMFQN